MEGVDLCDQMILSMGMLTGYQYDGNEQSFIYL